MSEMKIALAGNPNSGKTTLFNALTGANQYVGNWPGVTVEKKEGLLKGHNEVVLTDLPGVYSLSPYTLEEVVARKYLLNTKLDALINLVDASNIERNLYLTTQLMEMGYPVVIALNMMDIVHSRGDKIDTARLRLQLGCPIIECTALKGEGIQELIAKAIATAKSGENLNCLAKFSEPVEEALAAIETIVGAKLPERGRRWALVKLFERDEEVYKSYNISVEEKQKIEKLIHAVELANEDDAEAVITNDRYAFIDEIMQKAVVKSNQGGLTVSDEIDQIVTNRFLAFPIFFLTMFAVYYLAIETIGADMTDWVNDVLFGEILQPAAQEFMENSGCEEWLTSLVVNGIVGGVGAALGFTPQMAVVFLLLSFLEDCGYMSRIAFIMDRVFRQWGMSGRSFIPLLVSSGCGVPGLMACRTIQNETERRLTLMTTTFVPCGAKLPVIALMAGAIMGGEWYLAPIMYFLGFFSVIICSIILKKSELFAGESSPFVMELPPYHMPTIYNLVLHTWERVKHFLIKAGTIIFLCCIMMWFLASFGMGEEGFGLVDTEASFLAAIAGGLAPVFAPLGFGSWEAVAAALSGFIAKESIVSTFAILTGLGEEVAEDDAGLWKATMGFFPNASAAFCFLVFNLMDSPCLAAIATMAREMNSKKWAVITVIFQNVYAYALSLMLYQFAVYFWTDQGFTFWTGVACALAVSFLFLLLRPAAKADKKSGVTKISANAA